MPRVRVVSHHPRRDGGVGNVKTREAGTLVRRLLFCASITLFPLRHTWEHARGQAKLHSYVLLLQSQTAKAQLFVAYVSKVVHSCAVLSKVQSKWSATLTPNPVTPCTRSPKS